MSWLKQKFQGKSTGKESYNDTRPANLSLLFRWLDTHLNTDEFYDLCRALKIDYENLPGVGKSSKIRELIMLHSRHGNLDAMIEAGQKMRPELDWSQWGGAPHASDTTQVDTAKQPLYIDNSATFSNFTLAYDYVQFRKFMQEAFTLAELITFIDQIPEFKQYRLNLPADATHSLISRELLSFAQRHRSDVLLLEKLETAKPELYQTYGPFIESGQLHVDVKLVVKGTISRLKNLMTKQPGKAFDEAMLQTTEDEMRKI